MAIDMRRVAEAALEAAIKEATPPAKPKKRRLSSGRALLLGAGIVTAGRIVAGPKAREMFGHVQQKITDSDWYREEPSDEIDDYDEEPDEAEGDYEAEPEAEADDEVEPEDEFEEDEPEDEADDEPEDEADEEPEDESLERTGRAR